MKSHVSEILSKLGLSSRQEAARWHSEEGKRWLAGLAPLGAVWHRANISWLAPAAAGVAGVAVVASVTLLLWGLVRTGGAGGAGASPATGTAAPTALSSPTPTPWPAPADNLVWGTEDDRFRVTSVHPGTCGDEATASTYGVPMMLHVKASTAELGGTQFLGLEPDPYPYVPGQVPELELASPDGWELSMPVRKGMMRIVDLYLRRLDRPSLLFHYSTAFCDQEDASPAEPPEPLPDLTLELPTELPLIVRHREGNYVSPQEAMNTAMEESSRGSPVAAALGTEEDIFSERGLGSIGPQPGRVVWAVVLALGDTEVPTRLGHERGAIVFVDATTGEFILSGCCLDLIMPP